MSPTSLHRQAHQHHEPNPGRLLDELLQLTAADHLTWSAVDATSEWYQTWIKPSNLITGSSYRVMIRRCGGRWAAAMRVEVNGRILHHAFRSSEGEAELTEKVHQLSRIIFDQLRVAPGWKQVTEAATYQRELLGQSSSVHPLPREAS